MPTTARRNEKYALCSFLQYGVRDAPSMLPRLSPPSFPYRIVLLITGHVLSRLTLLLFFPSLSVLYNESDAFFPSTSRLAK